MRYLVRRIRSNGTPVVGTIDTMVREYANDTNAKRYMAKHLRANHFPPGQYLLTTFPRYHTERKVCTLYKQA